MKYDFMIEITLNDELIISEGKYEVSDVYRTIIDYAKEQHLTRLKAKDEKTLLFGISGDGKDDLAYIALFETALLNSEWFRRYVKDMFSYENEDGKLIKEDTIRSYDEIMKRNGL